MGEEIVVFCVHPKLKGGEGELQRQLKGEIGRGVVFVCGGLVGENIKARAEMVGWGEEDCRFLS